jgi:hypothetical protein
MVLKLKKFNISINFFVKPYMRWCHSSSFDRLRMRRLGIRESGRTGRNIAVGSAGAIHANAE